MKKNESDDFEKYCNCLGEVKWRIEAIESILNGHSLGKEALDIEFSTLQLRKCLELIAFSSLTANRTVYSEIHNNFQKHWNAKRLLSDLEKINSGFYPQPMMYFEEDPITKRRPVKDLESGFLTKEDLLFLYDKCGAVLHSRNPYKEGSNVVDIKRPFREWIERIKNLLFFHQIKLYGSENLWLVFMNHPETKKVTGYEMAPEK